ncbi:MAG: heme-binding protein [Vicinamibacterales bacterium]
MGWPARVVGVSALIAASAAAAGSDEPLTLDKKVLTLAAARKIITACEAAAHVRGVGVVTVVVDDGGNIIELSRMDTAQVASVNVGIGKARTAAIYRRPSRVFEEQIKSGRVAALALADATPLQGGVPILIDGKVVGAVGVSGDTPQVDEDIAIAGADVLAEPEAATVSQDPLKLYPENYKILAENDRVRVLDFRLAKGATETTHSHPTHVAVFLTDVKIRFRLPNGETRLREARAGDVAYSDTTAHASENIGSADAHGILIELKAPAARTAR